MKLQTSAVSSAVPIHVDYGGFANSEDEFEHEEAVEEPEMYCSGAIKSSFYQGGPCWKLLHTP
jgi:hypothetical protein